MNKFRGITGNSALALITFVFAVVFAVLYTSWSAAGIKRAAARKQAATYHTVYAYGAVPAIQNGKPLFVSFSVYVVKASLNGASQEQGMVGMNAGAWAYSANTFQGADFLSPTIVKVTMTGKYITGGTAKPASAIMWVQLLVGHTQVSYAIKDAAGANLASDPPTLASGIAYIR